jgi:hypothetical protein
VRGTGVEIAVAAGGAALAVLLASGPAAAFVPAGHKVLEAVAYREMGFVSGPGAARTEDLDILADLTRDGVFEKPLCFENASDDCSSRYETDPLAWWLTPHTDAPDRILARQFDHIGQCFHFMAQSDDEKGEHYTTPAAGNGPHASYGLIWDAYDRCIGLLESLVGNVVDDPVSARRAAVGMYELMHAIMDSYSLAHVERDYATWAPSDAIKNDPRIAFLKVWQPTVPNPFGGSNQNTRHEIFESRDEDFIDRFRIVDGRPCTFYVPRPYSVPAACLSQSGRLAVEALKDAMRVVHALRALAQAKKAKWAAIDHASWQAFVQKHFAHVAAPERLKDHAAPSPERLEIPYLFFGTRALFAPALPRTDFGVFGRYVLTSGRFNPISLGLSVEAGSRHDFRERQQSFMVRQDIEVLLTLGDNIVLGMAPFSVGYFTAPSRQGTIEVVTRLGRLEWFEPFGMRRLALTAWGPAEYSWLDEEAHFVFGLGVSGALLEHVAGVADTALRRPKPEPASGPWQPPEPWASELRSSSGPILVGAYAGATSGARGLVTGADGKIHEGVELAFWRRNWWGELNPVSFSLLVDDAIDVTPGAAPHTSLGGYVSGRLYLLGPLGAIVTMGADTGDLSGAHLRPPSVQGRGGVVLSIGDLDLIVESPTVPRYSFLAHEILSARIALQLFALSGR